jgi:AraC family transcriptional regulator, arabinose operon regulatory protein
MIDGSGFDCPGGMDHRVAHTIGCMENAIDRDVPVSELAAAVNLSPSRLTHLFRRETGVPPARYRHTLRMERARLLLERTCLSVKEVMTSVGVHDPSHFSRDFRRYHGVAPTGLRERRWAADQWCVRRLPPRDESDVR